MDEKSSKKAFGRRVCIWRCFVADFLGFWADFGRFGGLWGGPWGAVFAFFGEQILVGFFIAFLGGKPVASAGDAEAA
jgi:hypothetical protein